ncbi:unnamed protein product [Pleuronectes platessa]|uniref:Uncharacterized protein n=1 Tax=Pleuronectes platessa TaxID=8262 RepID=A0A9N7W0R0_PLEPL|nr:unnamed protein product [Pleuronectes platessa]
MLRVRGVTGGPPVFCSLARTRIDSRSQGRAPGAPPLPLCAGRRFPVLGLESSTRLTKAAESRVRELGDIFHSVRVPFCYNCCRDEARMEICIEPVVFLREKSCCSKTASYKSRKGNN